MARPRSVPSYRRHKQSGQAVVTLADAVTGQRRDLLLGKLGSRESKAEYGASFNNGRQLAGDCRKARRRTSRSTS